MYTNRLHSWKMYMYKEDCLIRVEIDQVVNYWTPGLPQLGYIIAIVSSYHGRQLAVIRVVLYP